MDELVQSMKKCHANTFVMYFKTHGFHWNVEGINFPTYHSFFGDLYEELYSAVDPIAEEIRALGVYAPKSLGELYNNCTLTESDLVGDSVREMLTSLLIDNNQVLACLNESFALATTQNNQGLVNFLADRIDKHKKHGWMISSSLKGA